jgi:hypothetical protein
VKGKMFYGEIDSLIAMMRALDRYSLIAMMRALDRYSLIAMMRALDRYIYQIPFILVL